MENHAHDRILDTSEVHRVGVEDEQVSTLANLDGPDQMGGVQGLRACERSKPGGVDTGVLVLERYLLLVQVDALVVVAAGLLEADAHLREDVGALLIDRQS